MKQSRVKRQSSILQPQPWYSEQDTIPNDNDNNDSWDTTMQQNSTNMEQPNNNQTANTFSKLSASATEFKIQNNESLNAAAPEFKPQSKLSELCELPELPQSSKFGSSSSALLLHHIDNNDRMDSNELTQSQSFKHKQQLNPSPQSYQSQESLNSNHQHRSNVCRGIYHYQMYIITSKLQTKPTITSTPDIPL